MRDLEKKDRPKKNKGRFKSNWDIIIALFIMIKQNKKWWLLPFLLMLAFLSLFVTLTGDHSILPAIYALF